MTASHCNYTWEASFVSGLPGDEGARCITNVLSTGIANSGPQRSGALRVVSDSDPTAVNGVTSDDGALVAFTFAIVGNLAPNDLDCSEAAKIRVTVGPTAVLEDLDTPGLQGTYTSDGRYVQDGFVTLVVNPDRGAVLHTTFTVTATPVAVPKQHDECEAVSEETEVKTNSPDTLNDNRVEAELLLLATPLENVAASCVYDVAVEVPAASPTGPPPSGPTCGRT